MAEQNDIDAAIARNADVELLYDRPLRARGVVRVAGPFTVESLSPHRVLAPESDPLVSDVLSGSALPAVEDYSSEETDFAQVVFENLRISGVENTKKGEKINFLWLKPYASKRGYIQFEGKYLDAAGDEKRAAVTVGPEYDAVGYDLVRNAARESKDLFDTLIVCGFAFAPEIDETRLNFGELKVLKTRMNQDLRMGDRLKAAGAGLFVVFGEPDIKLHKDRDGMLRVEIVGVDIFDPTTGVTRSSTNPAEDIACWFIDDEYDDESFFVRHAYFLGRDPYESLKRALRSEIDEQAWSELNTTISRPFPTPRSGRICIKVINHFGDEVQKVFSA